MEKTGRSAPWTLAELDALPEDGNTYELVDGELLVSPPPSVRHELIADVLLETLVPYVRAQRLGRVARPQSVIRRHGSQAEPDLQVRQTPVPAPHRWEDLPLPILVVEILSPSTRRHDEVRKRTYYVGLAIEEYWIVDGDARTVTVVSPGREDAIVRDRLTWRPAGASEPLVIDLPTMFREALGD